MGEPLVKDGVIVIPLRVNMCLKGLTLEQLVERRKELHMAMVRNLAEELAIQAPAALAGAGAGARPRVLDAVEEQFGELGARYAATPAEEFNDDERYKALTAEAIEGKSLAIRKVEVVSRRLGQGAGEEALAGIVGRPLADFGDRAVVLAIETGMADFPWADIVGKKAVIDFGRGRPPQERMELIAAELGNNPNFRMAKVLRGDGPELLFAMPPEGWAAGELPTPECKELCKESPVLFAAIARNCRRLARLDLRCRGGLLASAGGAPRPTTPLPARDTTPSHPCMDPPRLRLAGAPSQATRAALHFVGRARARTHRGAFSRTRTHVHARARAHTNTSARTHTRAQRKRDAAGGRRRRRGGRLVPHRPHRPRPQVRSRPGA